MSWTMRTFSVDARDYRAEPKSQSLSNPLERAWVRGSVVMVTFKKCMD